MNLRLPFTSSAAKGARPLAASVWVLAATGAVALHVAGAAIGYVGLNHQDESDDLGATAIEIGLEPTALRGQDIQGPVGPDQEAYRPQQAVPEQKAVEKQTELPKETPTESDDPDRAVSPDDPKKSVEKSDETSKRQQDAQDYIPAQQAMVAPRSETLKEGSSTAPVLGMGDSVQKAATDWLRLVNAIFSKHLHYPDDRVSKKLVVVGLSFVVDRTGHILSVDVTQGSGDPAFDEAAMEMVRQSDPLPPPVLKPNEDSKTSLNTVQFHPEGGRSGSNRKSASN